MEHDNDCIENSAEITRHHKGGVAFEFRSNTAACYCGIGKNVGCSKRAAMQCDLGRAKKEIRNLHASNGVLSDNNASIVDNIGKIDATTGEEIKVVEDYKTSREDVWKACGINLYKTRLESVKEGIKGTTDTVWNTVSDVVDKVSGVGSKGTNPEPGQKLNEMGTPLKPPSFGTSPSPHVFFIETFREATSTEGANGASLMNEKHTSCGDSDCDNTTSFGSGSDAERNLVQSDVVIDGAPTFAVESRPIPKFLGANAAAPSSFLDCDSSNDICRKTREKQLSNWLETYVGSDGSCTRRNAPQILQEFGTHC